MIWRPPASPWRGPRPPLIDLTAGVGPPMAAPEPPAKAAERAERHEALMGERAMRQTAQAEAEAAAIELKDERRRRLAAEEAARALRQRVETAEAQARKAERFIAVARGALRPETFDAIGKLAARRPKALPRAEAAR